MKFKLDENLPTELVADLQRLGHDPHTVFDEGLAGVNDPAVIKATSKENRILLTLDKGIANLQQYPAEQNCSIVLFRPLRSGRGSVLALIRERLPSLLEFVFGEFAESAADPSARLDRHPLVPRRHTFLIFHRVAKAFGFYTELP